MLVLYATEVVREYAVSATDESAARHTAVTSAVHTAALEAGRPSPQLAADLDRYRNGTLSGPELVRRTAARYGRDR